MEHVLTVEGRRAASMRSEDEPAVILPEERFRGPIRRYKLREWQAVARKRAQE
jgi:hypothetical protein